jgi:hypothetical protein
MAAVVIVSPALGSNRRTIAFARSLLMRSDPQPERFISNVLLLPSRQSRAISELPNFVDQLWGDRPWEVLRVARFGSGRLPQQCFAREQCDKREHLLGRDLDPRPFGEPGEQGVVSTCVDDTVFVDNIVPNIPDVTEQLVPDVESRPRRSIVVSAVRGREPNPVLLLPQRIHVGEPLAVQHVLNLRVLVEAAEPFADEESRHSRIGRVVDIAHMEPTRTTFTDQAEGRNVEVVAPVTTLPLGELLGDSSLAGQGDGERQKIVAFQFVDDW